MPVSYAVAINMIKQLLTPGTTYYMSLHSQTPGRTGLHEASGGLYHRQAFKMGTPASTGKMTCDTPTTVTITTPTAAGSWPYFGIWTAQTGGTFLGWTLTGLGAKTIPGASPVTIAKSNITAVAA